MPKTNHGGASAYGLSGVVEDAQGKRSELDPSRKLDGSAVDDFESDERPDITEPSDEEKEANLGRPVSTEPGVREDYIGIPQEERTPEEEKREEDAEAQPSEDDEKSSDEKNEASQGSNASKARATRARTAK